MSLIKLILFLFLMSAATSKSWAQEGTSASRSSQWTLNLSTLYWDESFKLRQGGQETSLSANFNGLLFSIQREYQISRWGYAVGLSAGTGEANGGNSAAGYQHSKVAFSLLGVAPRGFYAFNEKISGGLSALIFSRRISWPTAPGQSVDIRSETQASLMADLNIRLFQHWDYYQAVGILAGGESLWKVGVSLHF